MTAARIVLLTLQYAGTRYVGWQVQRGLPTIQGTIEEALGRLLDGEPTRLHAAGRTDAGVHARAQTAHFETAATIPVERLQTALNHLLPWDIRVTHSADAPQGFHARRSAIAKEYRYRIHQGDAIPPESYPYALLVRGRLDLDSMRAAAARLVGKHDFASMRSTGSSARTSVRTVARSEWLAEGPEIVYRIEADGFLYKMVRTIVGTMLEVGRGRRTEASLDDLIRSGERGRAGAVVCARGLHLWGVSYPPPPGTGPSPGILSGSV